MKHIFRWASTAAVIVLALLLPYASYAVGTDLAITVTAAPVVVPTVTQLFPTSGGTLESPVGKWSYGAINADGVNAPVLLNGSASAARGFVGRVVAVLDGAVYFRGLTSWWKWSGGDWIASTQPAIPPLPSVIQLVGPPALLMDNMPAGTKITDVNVLMSVDNTTFKGTLSISGEPGFFSMSGASVVTSRQLTATDQGKHSTKIVAQ